eukprot:g1130.t1
MAVSVVPPVRCSGTSHMLGNITSGRHQMIMKIPIRNPARRLNTRRSVYCYEQAEDTHFDLPAQHAEESVGDVLDAGFSINFNHKDTTSGSNMKSVENSFLQRHHETQRDPFMQDVRDFHTEVRATIKESPNKTRRRVMQMASAAGAAVGQKQNGAPSSWGGIAFVPKSSAVGTGQGDSDYDDKLNSLIEECRHHIEAAGAKATYETKMLQTDIVPALLKTQRITRRDPDMLLVLYQIPDRHWERRYAEEDQPGDADAREGELEPLLFYVHREVFARLNPKMKAEVTTMKLWDEMEALIEKYGSACGKIVTPLYGPSFNQLKMWAETGKKTSPRKNAPNARALVFEHHGVAESEQEDECKVEVDADQNTETENYASEGFEQDDGDTAGGGTGTAAEGAATSPDAESEQEAPPPPPDLQIPDPTAPPAPGDVDEPPRTASKSAAVAKTESIGNMMHKVDKLRSLTHMENHKQSWSSLKDSAHDVIRLQDEHLEQLHRCKIRGTTKRLGELFYKRVKVHIQESGRPIKVRSRLTARGVQHALHFLYNPRESWNHIPAAEFSATLHFFFQLAVQGQSMIHELRIVLRERPQIGCLHLARQYGYDKTVTGTIPKDQIMMRKNAELLNLEEVVLGAIARNYSSEDVRHVRGYGALLDADKIAIAERRIANLEGLVRDPHIRFRTHFRDMMPPGTVEEQPLLPLTKAQRMARSRGYSHHFLARQEAGEKAEEEKKKAAEADAIQQRAANRELRAAAGASVRAITLTTASTDYSTKTNIDDYGAIGGGRRCRTKPMEQCGGSASSSATNINMRIRGRWSARRWPSFHPRARQIMSVVGRGFNRDYWARLEKFVADTVCEHGEAVVITGPMFLPKEVAQRDDGENGNGPCAQVDEQEKKTGFLNALVSFFRKKGSSETGDRSKFPRGPSTEITVRALGTLPSVTHVPTHFFKIVLVNDKLLACFLLPNCAIDSEVPVTFFLRSLQELESLSGITFFPEMRAERKAEWDSVEEAALRRIRAELQARSTEQAASAGKVLVDKKQGGGKKKIEHLCEVVRCKLKTFRFDRDEKQGQGQGTPKRDREHRKTHEF